MSVRNDLNTKDVKIAVPEKFLRTLEMSLTNCKINRIITWSTNFVISSATGETKFVITNTKIYVAVLTIST